MAILSKWNFNNNLDVKTRPAASEGLRLATSVSASGAGLGNVAFGLVSGTTDYGWEARNWSENAAFDAASDDFFKFTVDLTDYNNLQLSLLERQKAGGGINGPANYAIAYQIGNGPITTAVTNQLTSAIFAATPTVFNFNTVNELQTLNDNDATSKTVSFYLFGYNKPVGGTGTWRVDDVTISGDILPSKFSIAATDANKAEGSTGTDTPFTFTITRTADIETEATVSYSIAGSGTNPATANEDFIGTTGTVTFGANEAEKTITVSVAGDTDAEQNEEFTVELTDTTFGTIKTGTAIGSILNDDKAISIAATDAVKLEGNPGDTTNFTFTLIRTGDKATASSVQYTVSGGAADAADFGGAFPTGLATFAANSDTITITIPVSGDFEAESAEDFTVTLSNPTGGEVLIVDTATGTIQGDDNAFEIVTASSSQFEGNGGGTTPFTFTVNRYGDTTGASSVGYTVVGSGDKPADAIDFAETTGAVPFAANQTTATVTVNVVGDGSNEGAESFTVSLNTPGNGETFVAGKESAAGTILNDDATLEIVATDARKAEGNSETEKTVFTFTVNRGGDVSTASSVNYVVQSAGVNPADVTDFGEAFPSGLVEFAAGEASKTISIEVAGDTTIEANETFRVTLTNAANGESFITSVVLGTILDDDRTGGGTGGGGTGGGGTGGGGTGGGTDDGTGGGTDDGTGGGTDDGTGGGGISTGGTDGFTFADFPAVPSTVTTATGTAENETFSGDDTGNSVSGGDGSDIVAGFGGDDALSGDAGSDEMFGNQGSDRMSGGDGDDLMYGGQGNDAILGGTGNDVISGQIGDDRLEGGDGEDTVYGNVGNDAVKGNLGNDVLFAGQGDDIAEGNEGDDIISGDFGNDSLAGNDGNDILFGNADNDLIKGGNGDDWLLGGKDNDTLIGGFGNDAIFGDLGDDLLTGGDGGDFFGFRSGDGTDIIADFQNGVDIIGLEATFSFSDLAITQVDANTQIVVGDASITLQGVNATSITEANFAFIV
jgi:Calx-beta domain/RTX calcium-binding nonapeptide repeat (4 copies)